MDFVVNKNRYLSLVIMIIGGILGWYSTILMTNEVVENLPIPDKNQLIGVSIGIVLSFLYWLKKCYTIQIR